ncbi:MAG: DUF89 family protein [Proteobacteria bacterium]|nr:DUF89 family protein [Pseudomonadota bacterium]
MKIQEDCRPCLLCQMEGTVRIAGGDDETLQKVLLAAEEELERIWDLELTPPEISASLYEMAGAMCGSADPWLPKKIQYTREALKLLPELFAAVENAVDPFETAVRISIAGNVIDFGVGNRSEETFDLGSVIGEHLEKKISPNDLSSLRGAASCAGNILFIGDNAGETVFDRVLLSQLKPKRLVYAARGGPVINDATVKDALLAGIGLHGEVVSTGAAIPGAVPEKCSREFQDLFREADLIIAKGQGNFETLSELPQTGRLFFLFVIKCSLSSRQIGGEIGNMAVMKW